MHVQVATYQIADISEPDLIEVHKEFAEAMAPVPGLLAKVWLKGAEGNVYGGLYLWEDRAAYEAFLASELWAEALKDESIVGLHSDDFSVMEELTKITQPRLSLLPSSIRDISA